MSASPVFFPFHPRPLRLWLLAAVVASALVAGAAAANFRSTHDLLAAARVGIGSGLLLAFAWLWYRLRPRKGWGVQMGESVFSVSRPLSADTVVPWPELQHVTRVGSRRQTLRLELATGMQLFLPRALFGSEDAFDTCARAFEQRAPSDGYDA